MKQILENANLLNLFLLDKYMGIIPAVIGINQIRGNSSYLSIRKLIRKIREVSIIQHLYGELESKKYVSTRDITLPESHIFEQPIQSNYLGSGFTESIVSDLVPNFINSYSIKPGIIHIEQYSKVTLESHILQILHSNLFQYSETEFHPIVIKERFLEIQRIISLTHRIELTTSLNTLFGEIDTVAQFVQHNPNSEILKHYENNLNLVLVGTIRGLVNQPVVYLLSAYKINEKISLDTIHHIIQNIMITTISNNVAIKKNLEKCRALCNMPQNECYLNTLVYRLKQSNIVYALHSISFSKELFMYHRNKKHPFRVFYRHSSELNLDIYFNVNSFASFSLTQS